MAVNANERRLLQATVTVVGLVPVLAGGIGGLFGPAVMGQIVGAALDSHVRYLSGLLLGIGLAFWSTIPNIEKEGGRFSVLTLIVVIGGFCRALGVLNNGWPGTAMTVALGIELVVTPSIYLWQRRIAHQAAMDAVAAWH